MKKKNIVIVIIVSLVLIFHEQIFIGSWIAAMDITGHIAIMKADIIEKKAREANRKAAEKWIVSKYGEAVAKVVKLEYRKRVNGFGTDSIFRMDAPFATGTLFVESDENHLVEGDFDLEGSKFQHLYSEWVKKQVGIDDENVELGFTGSYDTPYVEFEKITSLSEDYREVFENTHRFYLDTIKDKNSSINEENYIDFFYNIKNDVYIKSSYITGKPNEPYSLFVYIDSYRFIYNFPEEEIASIRKNNEKINLTSMLNYKKK